MATSAKHEVEKFDGGSGFSLWKIRIKSSMVLQGLWKAVEDDFPKEINDADRTDLKEKALSAIFTSVTDNVLRNIAGETSASAAWKKLENLYSRTNRLYLKKKLYSLRMSEGTFINDHLDEFNSIVMDLKNIDIEIENEDLALIVLCSLPPSYETFVHSLLSGKDSISLDHVSNLLKKKVPEIRDDRDFKKNLKNRSKSRMKNANCFECGELGHYKRDCPANSDPRENTWVLDTWATYHMCPHEHWFIRYKPMDRKVYLHNGQALSVAGVGDVELVFNGIIRTVECWHVPELKRNLISLGTLDSFGFNFYAEGGVLTVCEGSTVLLKGSLVSGLYILQGNAIIPSGVKNDDQTRLWHYRLGHIRDIGLTLLGKQNLLDGFKTEGLDICEHCEFEKETRVKSSKKATHDTTLGKLDYIHSDLWGPTKIPSKSGSCYFMVLIDDYSRMVWVYFLKTREEAFPSFLKWKTMIEEQTERKVKRLCTENGLEFCNKAFNNFCKSEGIVRHGTCPGTPQQNGIAVRMNRTLYDKARSMLLHSGVEKDFWAEAINTAAYLVNRSPLAAIDCKTPFEVWSNSRPDYSHLKAFGCPAYVHATGGKLETKPKKCIFLGYASEGYRLWCVDPKSSRLIISRDVKFDESALL